MTFTEFGRRPASNGSYGTDHGKATPVLLFGPGLKRTVHGKNPSLTDLDGGNLKYQYDYRQLFGAVLLDWMGASQESLAKTGFADYIANRLDLFNGPLAQESPFGNLQKMSLENCWPNPVKAEVRFAFNLAEGTKLKFGLYNSLGQLVENYIDGYQPEGETVVNANLSGLKSGNYIYRLRSDNFDTSKILVVE
jgi:hypothetical protein